MDGRLGDSGTRGGDGQSKLDAAVSGGLRLRVKGARVLYLGARSGLEVSRLLDRVGPNGSVFAVEQDEIYRSDLEELSSKNKNLTVFIKDPQNPTYRIPVLFDALFCDLDHHDKVMIAVNNRRLGLLPGRPVYIFTDKLLGSEKDDMIKYCECPYHVGFTFSGENHYCLIGVYQPLHPYVQRKKTQLLESKDSDESDEDSDESETEEVD